MKTLFLLFDSLNRSALGAYGGGIPTPNFDRLAARSTVFDSHFAGSLPCMPARRDMQTGRLNFLHRSWGPLEPFDDSFAAQLKGGGTYCHLVSDHYHYFEDGGATYHTRYASWDFIRGQESDPWVAMVTPPLDRFRAQYHPMQFEDHRNGHRLQGMINRTRIRDVGDFPVVRCVDSAIAFLEENDASDNWLLQMETFDPHEPFHAPAAYRDPDNGYEGPVLDWPRYKQVDETPAEIAELRANYAALVRLCDDQLGRLLDHLDETDGWQDTAIILTTDHGFLLSEHDWWAKNRMPFYNEVARIPLMIHHPHHSGGRRISALTQTIDLMPTLLDLHGRTPGPHVQGRSLLPLVEGREARIRDVALYGIFGGAINATDGQHTYFRYPQTMESHDLFEYTLMPAHNRSLFTTEELAPATLHRGFDFTSGAPVLRLPARADAKRSPRQGGFADTTTVLYDLATDRPFATPDWRHACAT
ncbi:MAG: sulfatase [Candidatus Puniceispirillaceae bacterium]